MHVVVHTHTHTHTTCGCTHTHAHTLSYPAEMQHYYWETVGFTFSEAPFPWSHGSFRCLTSQHRPTQRAIRAEMSCLFSLCLTQRVEKNKRSRAVGGRRQFYGQLLQNMIATPARPLPPPPKKRTCNIGP